MAVARILAKLGLNIAEWQTNLTKAQQQANTFASANMMQVKNAIAGAFTVGAIVAFAKHAGDAAEQTINVSKALGISTTSFQALSAAAKLSGQSQEEVISMLQKLRKFAGAAAEGNKEAISTLTRLGLSMEGIGKQDAGAMLEKIAKASQQAATDSQVFNDVIQVLGRDSLPKMQAVLDEIAAGSLTELAEKYKLVINSQSELQELANAKQQTELAQQLLGTTGARWLGNAIGGFRNIATTFGTIMSGVGDPTAIWRAKQQALFGIDPLEDITVPKEEKERRRLLGSTKGGRGGGGSRNRDLLSEEILKQVEKANAERTQQDSSSSYQMGQSAADIARQEEMEKHRKSAAGYLKMMQGGDDGPSGLRGAINERVRIGGSGGGGDFQNSTSRQVLTLVGSIQKLLKQMVDNSVAGTVNAAGLKDT